MRNYLKNQMVLPNTTIRNVMKLICKVPGGVVIVTDDQQHMLGYIQDGDIRRAILKGVSLSTAIYKIMNPKPFSLPHGLTKEQQLDELKKAKRHRAPVIDKKGRIRDVVSYWNLQEKGKNDFVIASPQKRRGNDKGEVLIVGGAGYIGSILCRLLLDRGYGVRVLDKLIYGDDAIRDLYDNPNFRLIEGDILHTDTVVNAVFGVDTVVNLAAIVGDPACDLDECKTIMVNYISAKMLADIAKHMKVSRYILASTCSVYGASKGKQRLIEESPLKPLSVYAETKLKSEWGVLELGDKKFEPCVFRMATVYGMSPRPRFDLIVNILVARAVIDGEIRIFGGNQYRPNVHVYDAARAFVAAIEAPRSKVYKQIYNVGSNSQNYKIEEIGRMVAKLIPGTKVRVEADQVDKRDYNVSFEKISKKLGFRCIRGLKYGIIEIRDAVKAGKFADCHDRKYSNIKQHEYLLFG